jgi:AbrB family looped-hinge helix DNA binding protein
MRTAHGPSAEPTLVTTRVSAKGQIVIPADLRRRYGIKKGTRVIFDDRNDGIILRPANQRFYEEMKGIARGEKSLTRALVEEHAREREREDR